MEPEPAYRALAHLVVATNGWGDEAVIEYADQLVGLDDPDALTRACKSIARTWTELRRPPLADIIAAYDREIRSSTPRAIDPARVHCDGSGWTSMDPPTPCRRCQPAYAAIYDDVDKLASFVAGIGVEHLDVGVERVSGQLRYIGGVRPSRCQQATDPNERVPTFTEGVEIAWNAYKAQCDETGRAMSRRHFDKLVRGL